MKVNKIRQGGIKLNKGKWGFKFNRIRHKAGEVIPYNPDKDKWKDYFILSNFERRI